MVRLPRFRCARCGAIETGVEWPSHIRSTPELDRLQAHLSALMTYRTAAEVLAQMFPVDAGNNPETLRRHTFKVAESLPMPAPVKPAPPAEAIAVTLDSTFIRSCEEGERHLEVRLGNVETATGRPTGVRRRCQSRHRPRGADPPQSRRCWAHQGHGVDRLHRRLSRAAAHPPRCRRHRAPILDWFHIAMRLQHLTQTADGLSSDDPERAAAKAVIVEEVDRLRWRLWNGKAKDAQPASIASARSCTTSGASRAAADPSRPRASCGPRLQALDDYLAGQSDWLVNYAERHRAGLRVGTAITEGTANFLVNRRMNKSQQMRWSRRGADLLLQVRCAVYNGTLGSGFGQRFHAANDHYPQAALAA